MVRGTKIKIELFIFRNYFYYSIVDLHKKLAKCGTNSHKDRFWFFELITHILSTEKCEYAKCVFGRHFDIFLIHEKSCVVSNNGKFYGEKDYDNEQKDKK